MSQDSLKTLSTLTIGATTYHYYSLIKAQAAGLTDIDQLPFCLKVLLENLLRHEDGNTVTQDDLKAMANWLEQRSSKTEIAYHPARVLMQDFTGVPAVVDLAAMRAAMAKLGGDPKQINPQCPVDLVIDHSVQVDRFGSQEAFAVNVQTEMQRNNERYQFLRWGQNAFDNFAVVPPGTGICHQVNLEYLAQGIWSSTANGQQLAYPDTLVGTDSHTTMVNGLGVLGWGVGGIEAEAAMLGQAVSMLIPEVVGFRLNGHLQDGITATDLVLTVTQMLRAHGVVGKFVEFYGPGLAHLPLADRATIANMAPEYGATCGFFPIDEETIRYLRLTGRDEAVVERVIAYTKAQGLWRTAKTPDPSFTSTLELDLNTVEASVAGPKRPQDRVLLSDLKATTEQVIAHQASADAANDAVAVAGESYSLQHGDIVIAAITSCTNTSNPNVMIAAGLLAQNALAKGLSVKPWVKTSLAPGSKVVTDYLTQSGLQAPLNELGFNLVGYGCTTCIGNSGPLPQAIAQTIEQQQLVMCSVLSGNRNFEGRIHPLVKANWLASPPLVVAYALAGTTRIDLHHDPIGHNAQGDAIYLKDIWPTSDAIAEEVAKINHEVFNRQYADVFSGDETWQAISIPNGETYQWNDDSTYVQHPPFFADLNATPPPPKNIEGARILALLGDSITTDHISPAGAIKSDSPAGEYLKSHGVDPLNFNSYGSRRGNHEVMMRGTFANIRIRNEMAPGTEGGMTTFVDSGEVMPIYDAAMRYQQQQTPLVVVAGKEYGTGSSRDWAAKGTALLGVRAVIAESFERIHRSNLIGMGVLPLQFVNGHSRRSLQLSGQETITIKGLEGPLTPGMYLSIVVTYPDGNQQSFDVLCRCDTQNEWTYYCHGGILHYVLRKSRFGADT